MKSCPLSSSPAYKVIQIQIDQEKNSSSEDGIFYEETGIDDFKSVEHVSVMSGKFSRTSYFSAITGRKNAKASFMSGVQNFFGI